MNYLFIIIIGLAVFWIFKPTKSKAQEIMPQILQPSEYDISYFDGRQSTHTHNAGFSSYKRWDRDGSEFWKDIASHLNNVNVLQDKKILELACAKGFLVEDLREMGADAYGMDVSSYAIGESSPEVAPYLTVGNALTELSQYGRNEFDFVFSVRLMECLASEDVEPLIAEIKRISRKQGHIITVGTHLNETYYNYKTLEQWKAYGFPKGTILAQYNQLNTFVAK